MTPSPNVFPKGNATKRGLRSRKIRKKNPGIKSERVHVKQPQLHQGPRYNITFDEVNKAYGRMRKGRGFLSEQKGTLETDMHLSWVVLTSTQNIAMMMNITISRTIQGMM